MNQSRDLLQAVTLSGNCKSDVAQIVTALVEPVLRSRDTEDQLTFLTLFGREMLDPLEAERGIVSELFDPTAQATLALLRTAAPNASPKDVCWVYFFAVGAAAVSHANPARVERLSSGLCQPSNVEEVGSELIRFITSAWLGVLFPNDK